MSTEPNKTIPELSIDAQVLIARLKKLSKGDFIPYSELNTLVSGDVQDGDASALHRARHRLLKDDRMVFEVVRGKGLKRIEDGDSIGIGESATRRTRRLSRRAAEKMMCADYDKLTKEQKAEYNCYLSVLGALCMVTKTDKVKAIRDAAYASEDKLPLNKTLELFKT